MKHLGLWSSGQRNFFEKFVKPSAPLPTSSREKETEENGREKINQSGIKDERTCYTCGTKEHKIKDCESKLNIFITFKENLSSEELKRIMEQYGIVKSIKIKKVQTGQKKQAMVCFSKKERHKKLSQK